METIEIKMQKTQQYGIPAVTVKFSPEMEGTFNLQGEYVSGAFIPNFLNGKYELTDAEKELILKAIRRCGETGKAETLSFSYVEKPNNPIEKSTNICPHCGSYCFGDCQAQ